MSGPLAVLLFQLGPRIFASRPSGVARIAGAGEPFPELLEGSCLGSPWSPARRLVVRGEDGGEAALAVDQVLGLREVDPAAVRPLPPLAEGLLSTHAVAGLVLLDDAPTPLIDLPTLFREQRQPAPADARSPDA